MHHAMKCYENFDQYDVNEPVTYPDWSIPYTREFVQERLTLFIMVYLWAISKTCDRSVLPGG